MDGLFLSSSVFFDDLPCNENLWLINCLDDVRLGVVPHNIVLLSWAEQVCQEVQDNQAHSSKSTNQPLSLLCVSRCVVVVIVVVVVVVVGFGLCWRNVIGQHIGWLDRVVGSWSGGCTT